MRTALVWLAAGWLAVPGAWAADTLDRSTPVPPGPARPFQTAPVEQATLATGLRVAVAEIQRLPLVAVRLVLPFAGTAYEPAGKSGLAQLVGALMMEGAGGKDSLRFSEALESLGATLDVQSTPDALVATLFTVKENLDKAMGLLASMVESPALPPAELPRLQQEALTGLQIDTGDPAKAAEKELSSETFGAHPYGRTPDPASVSSLQIADARSFFSSGVRPDGAALAAAGDVSLKDFEAIAARHFGAWRGSGAAPAPLPAIAETDAAAPAAGMTITLIDMPGSQQSAIRAGHRSIDRSAPDYAAVQVMNFILGGSFMSRLNQNLREKHGWAYGAGSAVRALREGGQFFVAANVQTDATAPALREILKELSRMRDESVPADELTEAKTELAGSFVLGQQKVQDVAAQVASIELYGLPPDYIARFRQQILATTAQDVQAAARAHLRAADLKVVIAGDAAKVKGDLGQIAPVHLAPAAGGPAS